MTTGPPVIAGVDGSPHALDAVRWAGVEARSLDRALHVLHASVWSMVSHPVPPAIPAGHRQAMLDRAQRWVHEAANAARAVAPGVEVIERLVVGEPAAVLIGESRHAQQVVVAARGLDGPVAELLGSMALQVAQHAGCPVVVVRPCALGDPGAPGAPGDPDTACVPGNPERPVLVGVDGSAGSDGALEFAFEHAARWASPLVALHTWSDIRICEQDGTIWRTLNWATVAADEERLLAERLAGWQDKYPDVEVRLVITQDRPVPRLIEAAEGARLLVIGPRGRGGVPGMLLGATSQTLLYVAPCPIVIVRH
ncbi:MAG TPA: universal stress protein [Pseudonocardiaceae bacterium]|nr:universal stress protein [Pseudonocardiaceae bacterium]